MNLAARRLLQNHFREGIEEFSDIPTESKVAIVGGSLADPEVSTLREMDFKCYVTTLGIEGADLFLDLNEKNSGTLYQEYDLVLCSQVLEHVWDMENVFSNLTSLVKKGGYIWINCPASNMKHEGGKTRYFSAGYQADFVKNYLEKFNFQTVYKGELGSERLYKLTHHRFKWPSEKEYYFPIRSSVNRIRLIGAFKGKPFFSIFKIAKEVLEAYKTLRWSEKIEYNSAFATETFVLAIRK